MTEQDPNTEREFSYWEHFAELRTRMIRAAAYVVVGMILAWCFYDRLFMLISGIVLPGLGGSTPTFLVTGLMEGMLIKLQITFIAGLIVFFPAICIEAWRFIAPALLAHERRVAVTLVWLIIVLFLFGVISAYFLLPIGIKWLVAQNPAPSVMMPSLTSSVSFVMGMLLAFGLLFQFPVVMMGLAMLRLISSRMLRTHWREVILITMIVAAIVTPSNDALTMIILTIPLLLLYFFGLGLVVFIERRRARREAARAE